MKRLPYSKAWQYKNEIRKLNECHDQYMFLVENKIHTLPELVAACSNLKEKEAESRRERRSLSKEEKRFSGLFQTAEEMEQLQPAYHSYLDGDEFFEKEFHDYESLKEKLKEHSIIDRCIRELYMRAWKVKKVPVMTDFYHILKSQKEMEAQELALSLELFVEGSLNIFNHQTNVDVDNRFTVYGIQDLGSQLAPVAMLVMMEAIQQRIIDNGKRGRATWLYIDECHVLLNSDYSATYLQQLWKKVRKQGGLCTGITQNVVDLLQNYIAMTLLSNSEFVALLKQANVDSAKLAEVIGVSDAQLQYVHNSPSGTGLLKCGSVVIPFDNQISKDSDLYKLYNTNIHEKIAMGMVGEDSIFHGYHSDEVTENFSESDDGTQETDVKIYEPVRSKEKKEQDNCWLIYE